MFKILFCPWLKFQIIPEFGYHVHIWRDNQYWTLYYIKFGFYYYEFYMKGK
jgi:hypothetical protein